MIIVVSRAFQFARRKRLEVIVVLFGSGVIVVGLLSVGEVLKGSV